MNNLNDLKKMSNVNSNLPDIARKYINTSSAMGTGNFESNYSAMKTAVDAVVKTISNGRIVVTAADGRVVYDSSKSSLNSHDNASANKINENHNSRISIMTACLNNSGIGMERKKSNTTGIFEEYLAIRIGKSSIQPTGVIRYSLPASE